jgi:hypothetical protein
MIIKELHANETCKAACTPKITISAIFTHESINVTYIPSTDRTDNRKSTCFDFIRCQESQMRVLKRDGFLQLLLPDVMFVTSARM